jgi:hypothetical protein
MADAAVMATFFHAWPKRQAEKQAAEWTDEHVDVRVAV